MGLHRILATTDFSSRSERALARAALLARESGARLALLHVVDDDQSAETVARESRQARKQLAAVAQALQGADGASPEITVARGDPFVEIVCAAAESEADLVVMGAHRRRILRDVFVGTTLERVLRTGHHPVLMANRDPAGPYGRVLVATDLSPPSAHALRAAHDLGLLKAGRVKLVHAFEPLAKGMMIYASVERERVEDHAATETARVRAELQAFVEALDLPDLQCTLRLDEGPAFHTIRKVVDVEQPDLLVIGTRGLTGMQRILLGSVADALLRNIECDVLAVPPPAQ